MRQDIVTTKVMWARICVVCALIFALPFSAPEVRAEEPWPNQPIRLIVPYSAGGPTDVIGRIIADGLARELKQTVIVENRPGAGASIGAAAAAKARPDGYTLLVGHAASVAATAQMRKVPYDPVKDFAPIAAIAGNFTILPARKDLPANNLAELKALALSKPDAVSCGTAGVGSGSHMTCGLLAELLGAKLMMVHYKGLQETMIDLIAGRIDITFDPTSVAQIRAGAVKALGTRGKDGARMAQLPNIPSFAEQGMPTLSDEVWVGLLAPAGTPAAIVNRVAAALEKIVALPETVEKLLQKSSFPSYIGPVDLKARVVRDMAWYGAIIDRLGLRAE